MAAPDDIYHQIIKERYRDGQRHEVERITVAPDLYKAAYIFMHKLFLLPGEVVEVQNGKLVPSPGPHFPLPVPELEYRMWNVTVVKGE